MGRSDIMTPEHPLWPDFFSKLHRCLICMGTTDYARAVLTDIPGIDVPASLEALAQFGGRCDCQIELDVPLIHRRLRS